MFSKCVCYKCIYNTFIVTLAVCENVFQFFSYTVGFCYICYIVIPIELKKEVVEIINLFVY